MSDDWLDTGTSVVPAVVALPESYAERAALAEASWSRLTLSQKTFLQLWRDCRYNAAAAARKLGSAQASSHRRWLHEPDYALVVRVWNANAAVTALDKDRLLARQDDIVETLLTPKPVLHQGIPVMHNGVILEEVEAGAAGKANEVLMQAAGILKSGKDVEVNVGVVIGPPTLNIQVLPKLADKTAQRESVVIDAKFTEVPSDEWLST